MQIVSCIVKQCHKLSTFSRITVNQLIECFPERHEYSGLFKVKPVDHWFSTWVHMDSGP